MSAAAFSLNHGANDAQKTMGIIAGVLFAAGYIETFYIPFWVVLAAHAAIGLGTLAGGWRIIHTMGSKITKLQPVGGFAAETERGDLDPDRDADRRAGQHDARDHRRDCRRRRDAAPVGGALGRRRSDRLGVGADDSRGVLHRRWRPTRCCASAARTKPLAGDTLARCVSASVRGSRAGHNTLYTRRRALRWAEPSPRGRWHLRLMAADRVGLMGVIADAVLGAGGAVVGVDAAVPRRSRNPAHRPDRAPRRRPRCTNARPGWPNLPTGSLLFPAAPGRSRRFFEQRTSGAARDSREAVRPS